MAVGNPFYPGYYPGDPIIKDPTGGGGIVGPSEFNLDAIGEEIDSIEFMLPNIPEWTKKQIEEDIKFQLRATFYGESEHVSTSVMGRYEAEERADLPGAVGVTLSLNPEDWKDPGKLAKKTLASWGRAVFSYDDLDGRVRREMWRQLLTKDESEWGIGTGALQDNTRHYARRIAGGVAKSPLKLTGIDPVLDGKAERAIEGILEFQSNFKSAFAREETYDDVLESSLELMKEDIKLQLPTMTGDARKLGESFVARVDFAGVAGEVDRAANGVTSALSRVRMETSTSIKGGLTPAQELAEKTAALDRKVREARTKIAQLKTPMSAGGKLSDEEIARLSGILDPFDSRLGEIQELLQQGPGTTAASQKLFMNRLSTLRNSTLGHRGIGPKSGDLFTPGIRGQYVRTFEEIFIGKEGEIGAEGRLLQEYFGRNGNGSVPKLRAIWARQYVDKEREMYKEFFDNLLDEKGNFSRTYIWKRISNTLVGYTPAYYVKDFLERVSYFGLVIKDDIVDATPKGLLYRASNTLIRNSRLFQNRFRIRSIDGLIDGVFEGGKHFEAVKDLVKLDAATLANLMQLTGRSNILAELTRLGINEPDEFIDKFEEFKKWLEIYKNRTGKDIAANSQMLKSFLDALKSYNDNPDLNGLGITVKYIGLLQRTGQFLSKLQSTLMNNVLGKLVSKVLSIKSLIAEGLAAAIGTIIPVLAPLERVISAIFRLALNAVEKFGKKIFEAILKGNIETLYEFQEESAAAFLKVAKIVAALSVIPLFLVFMVITPILSSISPDNKGKAVGGGIDDSSSILAPVTPKDTLVNSTNCPLQSFTLTAPSYNDEDPEGNCSSNLTCYHGSNSYWRLSNLTKTCYAIPSGHLGVNAPTDHPNPGNTCDSYTPKASYYGYAADYTGSNSVYAPKLGTTSTWRVAALVEAGSNGQGVLLAKPGYTIMILHIVRSGEVTSGKEIPDGFYLGETYDFRTGGASSANKHVHIEMLVDGVPVKPELHVCR